MSWAKQIAACLGVAAAAWISQSTLALTDLAGTLDRLALLPLSFPVVGVSTVAGALAAVAVRGGVSLAAFSPLALCALPWIPTAVPPALLSWSGPLTLLPWAAVAAAIAAGRGTRGQIPRPAVVAGVAAGIIFAAAAWNVSPTLPGGDEPHYLVITQSLIADGDLRIENNHQRQDYRRYFAGDLRPDFIRRGRDGQIYSIHAPGLPAIAAPAFFLGGYAGVVAFLVLVAALGSALAWHTAWLHTGRRDAAWFGWAAVTLGATTVFHAVSIYPDGPGAVIVLTGAWALVRLDAASRSGATGDGRTWPWLLHGAALALLPWLHTRFALLAGTLGVLIVLRLWSTTRALAKTAAFLAIPALSCVAWIGFFVAIYGVADPSAPYGGGELGSAAFIVDGLTGLAFDQRFGLLFHAPVLVFALAGLAVTRRRLAVELLLVIVPYLLVVTYFRMWWAGWSAPARFAMPVLLLLAVPAAEAWVAIRRRGTRATALGALVLTGLVTLILVSVDHGRLAYNVRTEFSLLLRWLARAADLPRAMPAWSIREATFFRDVAIWCGAALAAWAAVRQLDRAAFARTRPALAAAAACVFALAGMAAATLVWRIGGADGTSPLSGQVALLARAAAGPRALFVGLQPPRILDRDAVPPALRIRPERLTVPEGPAGDRAPIVVLPPMPAGEYQLRPAVRGAGGTLTIGIGRDGLPIQTIAAVSAEPIVLRLPVGVSGVSIRGDDEARRNVRTIVVEPASLVSAADRLGLQLARRAVAYASATVFMLDDRSFPEPDAFWLGGARESSVVVQAQPARAAITLLVRNAPVENRVVIQSGRWREELTLNPGEERRVDVPLDPQRGAALIEFSVSSGFRPSEHDAASRDDRYLGAWIKVL